MNKNKMTTWKIELVSYKFISESSKTVPLNVTRISEETNLDEETK